MKTSTNRYKNHRFPVEIIGHAVWLYFRFCLSYRDVEELSVQLDHCEQQDEGTICAHLW
jgi:transposase-like protein